MTLSLLDKQQEIRRNRAVSIRERNSLEPGKYQNTFERMLQGASVSAEMVKEVHERVPELVHA